MRLSPKPKEFLRRRTVRQEPSRQFARAAKQAGCLLGRARKPVRGQAQPRGRRRKLAEKLSARAEVLEGVPSASPRALRPLAVRKRRLEELRPGWLLEGRPVSWQKMAWLLDLRSRIGRPSLAPGWMPGFGPLAPERPRLLANEP